MAARAVGHETSLNLKRARKARAFARAEPALNRKE
jgi:hypothetical protein